MLFRKVLVDGRSGRERERFAAALEEREPVEWDGVRCLVTEMLTDPLMGTWVYLECPDSTELEQSEHPAEPKEPERHASL